MTSLFKFNFINYTQCNNKDKIKEDNNLKKDKELLLVMEPPLIHG